MRLRRWWASPDPPAVLNSCTPSIEPRNPAALRGPAIRRFALRTFRPWRRVVFALRRHMESIRPEVFSTPRRCELLARPRKELLLAMARRRWPRNWRRDLQARLP